MSDTVAKAIKVLEAATALTELASRAIKAANDGNELAAEEYLRLARTNFDQGSKAWDDAGK